MKSTKCYVQYVKYKQWINKPSQSRCTSICSCCTSRSLLYSMFLLFFSEPSLCSCCNSRSLLYVPAVILGAFYMFLLCQLVSCLAFLLTHMIEAARRYCRNLALEPPDGGLKALQQHSSLKPRGRKR